MPEMGQAHKEAIINEAQERLARIIPVKHKLAENETAFVISLDEKIKQYGYGAYISPRQLSWLRHIDNRYGLDPRQTELFQQ